jgi:hypothetical protein
VLGHSFGEVCAFEAAFHTAKIARLALYEPPVRRRSLGNTGTHGGDDADGRS